MADMGLVCGAVHHTTDLSEKFRAADDNLLKSIVNHQITVDENYDTPLITALSASEANDPNWRDDVIEIMKSRHTGKHLITAHPDITFGNVGLEVLKKNRDMRYVHQRRLAFERGYVSRFLPEVAVEVAKWDTWIIIAKKGVDGPLWSLHGPILKNFMTPSTMILDTPQIQTLLISAQSLGLRSSGKSHAILRSVIAQEMSPT
jgi:hypothetical protein